VVCLVLVLVLALALVEASFSDLLARFQAPPSLEGIRTAAPPGPGLAHEHEHL
jgi:hypothetical protein